MGSYKFIVIDARSEGRSRSRANPVALNIPDAVKDPSREKAKGFLQFALRVLGRDQCAPILCEYDAAQSTEIAAMFGAGD